MDGKNKNILVSIIVPVYNIEFFLSQCVESICEQRYEKLDIILVDDGSTDGSGKLCDDFAREDQRIRVFHTSNRGLSEARNYGIKQAIGKYVCFVDGDDVISETLVETLVKQCMEYDVDMVITPCCQFEHEIPRLKKINITYEMWNSEECMREMLITAKCGHGAYGKLYKVSLWDKIRFPKGKLYEDYLTLYRIAAECSKIIYCNIPGYWYRKRIGSIMHSKINEKKLSILEISEEVTNYVCQYSEKLKIYAIYRQVVVYLKAMDEILECGMNAFPNYQNTIMEKVKKDRDLFFKCPTARKADKLKLRALLINKRLFKILYRIGKWHNKFVMK